ncbi:MAG: helix-turn-helix domain-containing protein [Deltaproteobacteria bacterium]|nr:helix-turn-helix domain-containing protein [Deltaproteobacteria bacterium]
MKKKYLVKLNPEQICELSCIIKGKYPMQKRKRAQALLLASQPEKPDREIAEMVSMNHHSVTELRKRFVKRGYHIALNSLPHNRRPKAIDSENEARLVDLAAKEKAGGATSISLRRLARVFVTLDGRHVSHETIRQVLKKFQL